MTFHRFIVPLIVLFFVQTILPASLNAQSAPGSLSVGSSLEADPITGSASMSVPISVPQGRNGIQPSVVLSYNSGAGNGVLGMGWNLELGHIQRSTKFGPPAYDDSEDTFVLIQNGSAQELVDVSGTQTEFRPKIEGAFMKIVFDGTTWVLTDKNGVEYSFGSAAGSRLTDPGNSSHIFQWGLDRVEDLHTNYLTISYIKEDGEMVPDEILYTGNTSESMSTFAKVDFIYSGTRTDVFTRYTAGFEQEFSKRLEDIKVYADATLFYHYDLTYETEAAIASSLLTKITKVGKDDSTSYPPLLFTYSGENVQLAPAATMDLEDFDGDFSTKRVQMMDMDNDGFIDIVETGDSDSDPYYIHYNDGKNDFGDGVAAANGTSIPTLSNDNLRVVDLNADGLMDIVQGTTSVYKGWINNGEDGFGSTITFSYYPASEINDNLVTFIDMDRDGFADILESLSGSSDYKIYFNDGDNDFEEAVTAANSPSRKLDNANVRLADFNGDGLSDVVYQEDTSFHIWLNNGEDGFTHYEPTENYPDHTSVDTGYVLFFDTNSDGLADIVDASSWEAGWWYVYVNDGQQGFNERIGLANALQIESPTDPNLKIIDFNGDGNLDLFYGPSSGDWKVRLGTGRSGFAAPVVITQHPNSYINEASHMLADLNADGKQDIIYINVNSYPYKHWLNTADSRSAKAGILVFVDNSWGAQSTIEYRQAGVSSVTGASYKNQIFNSYVFNTVSKLTRATDLGNSYETSLEYQNCVWNYPEREFRGFGWAKLTDAQGNYSVTTYKQDDIFKGRADQSLNYDANDDLFSKTVNTWDSEEVEDGVNFAFLERRDNFVYDGDSEGRRTAEEFFYEETTQLGNLTKTVQLGEVDFDDGTDIGTDKRTVEVAYVNNTSSGNWLVGLPKQHTVKDNAGDVVRKTYFYYDGNTSIDTAPTAGLLTKKEDWGGDGQGDVSPVTLYTYNDLGNLATTTDPQENTTTITYDTEYGIFPVETENALEHTVSNVYFGVDGTPWDNGSGLSGLWGQLCSTTDPNDQTGDRTYDVLGRLKASISPLDSVGNPTGANDYMYYNNHAMLKTKARLENGQTGTINVYEFYDGLGRLIQKKSPAETPGTYNVSGQTEYNDRGLPVKKYVPFFSSNPLQTVEPIDPDRPHTTISYDAMGRVVQTTNPDGTYASVSYDDWTTTTIDENGHMQKSYFDAYGRLIKKEEYTGADGRSSHYSQTSGTVDSYYTLYATTLYTYDSEGNLTRTEDEDGNITTITYDELGRKVAMDDPDMGEWTYLYDANGNLVSQTDAKSQEITFTYDALNRLTNKTDGADLDVDYTYDDTQLDNSIGRLTEVSYNGGDTTSFDYDPLGRETSSAKTIDSTEYTVNRTYDAMNRLTSVQYPDDRTVYYSYNAAGQIEMVADEAYAIEQWDVEPSDPEYLDAPFLHLKLNDNAANTTVTDTGTGENTITSIFSNTNAISVTGHLDKAFYFDGATSGHCVDMDSFGSDLTGQSTGAFSFWAKDVAAGKIMFNAAYDHGMGIVWVGSTSVMVLLEDNGTTLLQRSTPGTADLNDGAWHHIVVSQDGTELKIFIDGSQQTLSGTNTVPGAWFDDPAGTFADASFGCRAVSSGYDHYNDAIYDDFRYYESALSADEVAKLYNDGDGTEEETPLLSGNPGDPLDSPTMHLKLNDDAANTSVSNTGTEADTTASIFSNTSVLSTTGLVDKAFAFDGDECVDTDPFGSYLTGEGTGAFSFWVKDVAAGKIMFNYSSNSAMGVVWVGSGSVMVLIENSTQTLLQRYNANNINLNDGAWHHIVTSQDGTELKIFIDGIQQALAGTNTTPGAWFDDVGGTFSDASFGCRAIGASYDHYNTAAYDDFRYYEGGLSQAEVLALYSQGEGTEEENPEIPENPTGSGEDPDPLPETMYVKSVEYNAAGQITEIVYGNDTTTTYAYDEETLRLTNLTTVNDSEETLQDFDYTYDSVGNILTITDNVNTGTQEFEYDALNRLVSADGDSYGEKTFAYDEIGNLTSKDGLTYYYGSNAGPHAVTSLSDGTTYTYDANGNMATRVKDSVTRAFTYDAENRLIEVVHGGNTIAEYEYDGDGGRTKKIDYTGASPVTTAFVGSLFEIDGSRESDFIYLGSQRIAAINDDAVSFYHADHLGGINVITDDAGDATDLIEYEPFGEKSTHEKYGSGPDVAWHYFTGQRLDDETGLYFYGARYYNPSLGRFITPDSIVQDPTNPVTLNRYAYTGNNPVNNIDPSGHSFWKKIGNFFKKAATYLIGGVLGAPYVEAAFEGNWGMVAQGALNAIGLLSGNPFFMVSAGLNIIADNNAYYGGSEGFTRGLKYASTAVAAAYVAWNVGVGIKEWAVGKANITDLAGNPASLESGDSIYNNGMLTDLEKAKSQAAYFNKVKNAGITKIAHNQTNGFIADFTESFLQKITFTSSIDRQLANAVQGLNNITLVGHSQGTLTVGNALLNLGFRDSRNIVTNAKFYSTPLSQPRAFVSAAIGGGLNTQHVTYGNNWGDPINIAGPNFNLFKFASGFTFQLQNH